MSALKSKKRTGKNPNWVDFKALKKAVSMKMVLDQYGIELKEEGESLVGCCPLHDGSNPTEFSVSTEKNAWHCFGNCHRGGNILDFVMIKEGLEIREAGELLAQWFGLEDKPAKEKKEVDRPPEKPEEDSNATPEEGPANPPLTFELQSLDPEHEYLKARGLTPETVKEFGLGFCSKGMMAGRIAIPIHNERGELVAYSGRTVEDPSEENPKYKLPPKFKKSQVVFNLHRIQDDHLVLVEGFFDVFWLWQNGVKNAVALMGSSLSNEQEALVVDSIGLHGRVTLLFDGDGAGRKCADETAKRLIHKAHIKTVALKEEEQPDKLTKEEIKNLLG